MGICRPNPTNTLNPTSAPHCQTSPKVLRADRFQVTPSQLASWMEQGGQDGRDLFKIGGRDGRVQIIPPHPPQQRQPKPLRITTPWLLRPSQGCPFTPCSATCFGGATSASHPARREAPPPPFTGYMMEAQRADGGGFTPGLTPSPKALPCTNWLIFVPGSLSRLSSPPCAVLEGSQSLQTSPR